jgi:hypothetical protein
MTGIIFLFMQRFKDYVEAAAAEGWIRLEHLNFETHLHPVDPENYPQLTLAIFNQFEQEEGNGRGEAVPEQAFGYQGTPPRTISYDATESPIFSIPGSGLVDDSQSIDTAYSPIRYLEFPNA